MIEKYKTKRTIKVLLALTGFQPGDRVRVIHPLYSYLRPDYEGKIAVLKEKTANNAWNVRFAFERKQKDKGYWLYEKSMELVCTSPTKGR